MCWHLVDEDSTKGNCTKGNRPWSDAPMVFVDFGFLGIVESVKEN